jgi:hypothetical protein
VTKGQQFSTKAANIASFWENHHPGGLDGVEPPTIYPLLVVEVVFFTV